MNTKNIGKGVSVQVIKHYCISRSQLIRNALLGFTPACVISFILVAYFFKESSESINNLTFYRFSIYIIFLTLAHLSMLMLLGQFIKQITRKTYKWSVLPGLFAAPLVVQISSELSVSFLSFWEASGMTLLMCIIAGWGVTIVPYLILALLPDLKHRKEIKSNHLKTLSRPLYIINESRYEYLYDSIYCLENIPVIEIYHKASLFGYLDPRWYKIHGYEQVDLAECWWRIFMKKKDHTWIEISSRISQAEGDDPGDFSPLMLEYRVSKAVNRVLEIKNEEFSFHQSEEELPEVTGKISYFDKNIDIIAPLYAGLETIIHPVIKGVINQGLPLGVQLELERIPGATHIIDVVDTTDYSHYYIAVGTEENYEKAVQKIEAKSMQIIHKIWKINEEDLDEELPQKTNRDQQF